MRMFKLQSAMEYLMTYGWAILIIAVVLGALFSLGVFNTSSLTGVSCIASPGFLCQNPVLGTNGNVSMTIGQSTGTTFYNVGLACAATANNQGLPNPTTATVFLTSSGAANGIGAGAILSNSVNALMIISSGQTISVSALKCFGTNANAIAGPAIGTSFSGSIWMNYTTTSGAGGPMLTQKIASISLKVV